MELLVVLRTRNIGMIHPHFLNSNTYIQYMYCRRERMCRNAFESQSKRPLNNNTITGRFLLVKYCALLTSKAVGNWIRQTNYCGQHNTPFMFGLLFGLGVFDNAFINVSTKPRFWQTFSLPTLPTSYPIQMQSRHTTLSIPFFPKFGAQQIASRN